jgi:hypothetical protein
MKRFLDFFRKKKTKPNFYLTKDYKGFPLWVIEPPESWDDPEDKPETIKEK